MEEMVPILLGIVLGVAIWRGTTGLTRVGLSILAATTSGAFATVLNGEYLSSWVYILLDVGEAALGLAVGFVVGASLPSSGRPASPRITHPGCAAG